MKPTPRVRRVLRLTWVAMCLLVVCGSLLPGTSRPILTLEILHVPDKALHLAGYALLAFLPALHESARALWLSVAGTLLLGFGLELAQYTIVDSRSFEVADLAANAAGVFAGLLLGLRLRAR